MQRSAVAVVNRIYLSIYLSICKLENEAILRDFLQKWKVECRADGLVPMCFAIFTFGSWDVEKVHAVVARSTFRSQNVKNTTCRTIFGRWTVVVAGATGSAPCQKRARREGFVAVSKALAGVGYLKRICNDAWRKCRRIASFLMLSTWKIEEVSQICFVFDVVKFKNWGSLAE